MPISEAIEALPIKRSQIKKRGKDGTLRFTRAFGGTRGDWYLWRDDVERLARGELPKCTFAGWSSEDWTTLTAASGTADESDSGSRPNVDDHEVSQLRVNVRQLEAELTILKRDLKSWQDAWASQQQAAEHRRAADEARSRAAARFNEGLKELGAVDGHRLLEIYHLNEALAAKQMPESAEDLG
jgi:hypothetical protein